MIRNRSTIKQLAQRLSDGTAARLPEGAAGNAEVALADARALEHCLPISVRVPEACRLTGLGRTTIYDAIRAGDRRVRRRQP